MRHKARRRPEQASAHAAPQRGDQHQSSTAPIGLNQPPISAAQVAINPASSIMALQRTVGNQAIQRLLARRHSQAGKPTHGARAAAAPIQRWGEMNKLGALGWKYSGGTMATTPMDMLWHASVYRVDKTGASSEDGMFYKGFHLTMENPDAQPHVFFDEEGKYDAGRTLGHQKTKNYKALVGDKVWAQDLETAKVHAATVFGTRLAKVLSEKERGELEEKRSKLEREKDIAAELAAQKLATEKQAESDKQAAALDEATHIQAFLNDVQFFGPKYLKDFMSYLADPSIKIDSKLTQKAEWYKGGRGANWSLTEEPQAIYSGWDKTPKATVWKAYDNCTERRWRAVDKGIPKEFRRLNFTGYASYKLHPQAKKPPAG